MGPATRPLTASVTLPLASDGTARLVVVSDTHSRPHPATAGHVAALEPDAILHAGDIGELAVLDGFAAIAPLFAVRGNIDERAPGIPDDLTLDLAGDGRALRLFMTHIAVYGPRLRADVARRARAAKASLVVCGHSHVPFVGQDRELTLFNPGSVGPRRIALPIVFGVIDVTARGVRLTHVDCETGKAWSPP